MTALQTVLVLAVIPAAIYGVVLLLVMWPRIVRSRSHAGEDWDFDPVLWVANPVGVSTTAAKQDIDQDAQTARGGARGNW